MEWACFVGWVFAFFLLWNLIDAGKYYFRPSDWLFCSVGFCWLSCEDEMLRMCSYRANN
jgi:hypothetical protein